MFTIEKLKPLELSLKPFRCLELEVLHRQYWVMDHSGDFCQLTLDGGLAVA